MKNKGLWWAFGDSNRGPIDYESDALKSIWAARRRKVTGISDGVVQGNRNRAYAEIGGRLYRAVCESKLKNCNSFLKPNSETLPRCTGMSGEFYSLLSRTKVIDTDLPILVGRTIHQEV